MKKLNKFNKQLQDAVCGLVFLAIHNMQTYLIDTDNQQKQENIYLVYLKLKATAKKHNYN